MATEKKREEKKHCNAKETYKNSLGDLEPVYDLFTIMGEIIPSESLSRVTYTGIDDMHSQKTTQRC